MCRECLRLARVYLPRLTDSQQANVLISSTAYPFCEPDFLKDQLECLVKETGGEFLPSLYYGDTQMEKEVFG